jgi:hypothetical protein
MVATLNNTVTKWRAVHNALLRANRGKLTRSFHVREHNAPTYQQVYTHFNRAFNNDNHNLTRGGSWVHGVRIYFEINPNKRQNIINAYNKLNNMARELAAVRRKAVAATTLQRHWRAARPGIMNKRKVTTLRALSTLPGVPNTRRAAFEEAFPRRVYGPVNELTHLRSYNKYNRY